MEYFQSQIFLAIALFPRMCLYRRRVLICALFFVFVSLWFCYILIFYTRWRSSFIISLIYQNVKTVPGSAGNRLQLQGEISPAWLIMIYLCLLCFGVIVCICIALWWHRNDTRNFLWACFLYIICLISIKVLVLRCGGNIFQKHI